MEIGLKGSGFRGSKVQGFNSTLDIYVLRLFDKEDLACRSLILVKRKISNAEYRIFRRRRIEGRNTVDLY